MINCIGHYRYVPIVMCIVVFFFKQKTAYEMRISDWSSDVCSSDLNIHRAIIGNEVLLRDDMTPRQLMVYLDRARSTLKVPVSTAEPWHIWLKYPALRSEEHTSELQSLMRISYDVFCLKKKT